MNPSPKKTFLTSSHREAFQRITETDAFQVACDYALLVMLNEQPTEGDINRGWDAHSQMTGAKRFREILESMHLPEQSPPKLKFPNLKP